MKKIKPQINWNRSLVERESVVESPDGSLFLSPSHNVEESFHFDPEGSSNLELLSCHTLLRFAQMKPAKQNLNSQALWSKRKKNLVLIPFSPSLHIQTFPQIATHCQPPKVTSSFHFTWNLSLKTRTFLKLPAGRHYSKVLFIPQFWQFWGSPSDSKRWF